MSSETPSAGVARLSLALHASIPPALFSVLMNSIVSNKTFGPCKLMGELMSPTLRNLLRRAYVVANGLLLFVVFAFLRWNCPTYTPGSIEDAKAQESCLPAHSLVAIGMLLLLWLDRGALAFLQAPGATNTTFFGRIAKGASCAGFLMSVSEQDVMAHCFLLLSLSNRYSGSVSLAPKLRVADTPIRIAVAFYSMKAIYYQTSSRRLAAMCLACTIHAR